MLEVVLLDPLPGSEVVLSHGLDDKLLILAEEEEAAGLALRLASLENHRAVDFRVERLAQDIIVVSVLLSKESEDIRSIFCNFDIFINDEARLHLGSFEGETIFG